MKQKQKQYLVRLHDGSELLIFAKSHRVEQEQQVQVYKFVDNDDASDQFVPMALVKWITRVEQSEPDGVQAEIHREHALLSNRMNWYVTSQAFLVAAFAVGGNAGYKLLSLSQLIPYIGIFVTFTIMLSIAGGLFAMYHLRKLVSFNCYGAPRYYHWLGLIPLWAIPLFFLPIWIYASHLQRVP